MIANRARRRVFVDLAPLDPAGGNGGVRPFVLGLLERLLSRGRLDLCLLVKPAAAAVVEPVSARGARILLLGRDVFEPRWALRRRRLLPGALRRPLDLLLPDRSSLRRLGAEALFSPLQTATFHEPDLPHVAVAYDFQDLDHPEFFTPHERRRRAELRLHLSRAGAVVAISAATRDAAVARAGVRPDRVTVLPPLSPPERTPLESAELDERLTRLGLARGSFAVYPANFWPHKNHERLLAAIASPRVAGLAGFRIALCGALDAGREEALARAGSLGISAKVATFPYLPEADVTALVQGARFLVFPSLFEGFGIPVLEAFRLGTAVACSALPALRELAGSAAFLFDPEDGEALARALAALWTDGPLRKRLVTEGSSRASAFRPEEVVERYEALLLGVGR